MKIYIEFDEHECALIIASAVINICIKNDIILNTSKLMKLLYFMQKEHILTYNKLMFTDTILARKNGPFIPTINSYYRYGALGFYNIDEINKTCLLLDSHKDVVIKVLKKYGNLPPHVLMKTSLNDPYYLDSKSKGFENINEYFNIYKKNEKTLKLKND